MWREKRGGSAQIDQLPVWILAWALIPLVSICADTVYQKHRRHYLALTPGTFIQFCSAAILFAIGAQLFESREVE